MMAKIAKFEKTERFDKGALDGLRGLCALHVAAFHIIRPYGGWHIYGCAAMPFFFLLSGFSLTVAYGSKGPLDLRSYYYNRIIRIMPLLFLGHIFWHLITIGYLYLYFDYNSKA